MSTKYISFRNYLIYMDSLVIKDQDIIKIINNVFPNSLEYLLFYVYPNKFEINGWHTTKSFFSQLKLENKAFYNFDFKKEYILSILAKEFNNKIKSITSKFLLSPSIIMQFDDKDITFSIADEAGRINIRRQIRSVPITPSMARIERLGIPDLRAFEDAPFCVINNPQDLRTVHSNFSDADLIEISIGKYSITFKGENEMDKVEIKARYHGSGTSKILTDFFKDASDICELKSIKETKISISKEGNVLFSHTLETGFINYYLSRAI